MMVLGIAVTADNYNRWQRWLAPDVQPFFVDSLRPWPKGKMPNRHDPVDHTQSSRAPFLSPELSHTFRAWRVDRSLKTLWLDEASFGELSRPQRAVLVRSQVEHGRGAVPSVRRWSDILDPMSLRTQADGHRFVWWPSLVRTRPHDLLARVVATAPHGGETAALPSRHQEVQKATWQRCRAFLPGARHLAGSFPMSSGPNCFGTVMATAGITEAPDECVLQAPFDAWLGTACRPSGSDDDAGTVLVWRDLSGVPVHSAITIGDGWALEKASGEWWTPCAIRTVADIIRTGRARGQRLERHSLRRASTI